MKNCIIDFKYLILGPSFCLYILKCRQNYQQNYFSHTLFGNYLRIPIHIQISTFLRTKLFLIVYFGNKTIQSNISGFIKTHFLAIYLMETVLISTASYMFSFLPRKSPLMSSPTIVVQSHLQTHPIHIYCGFACCQ